MSTPKLIQNFRDRMLSGPRIRFACPVCERDIDVRKTNAGADVLCPHCTAWIAAPDPERNLAAVIRDQSVLQVRQFQKAHGRSLVELKRGRLEASVLRKQQRLKDGAPPAEETEPALTAELPPSEEALSRPGDAVPPSPADDGGNAPPAADRPRPVKGATAQNAARSFQPRDSVPVATTGKDAATLSWDEEPDALSRPEGSILSGRGKSIALAAGGALFVLLLAVVGRELSEHASRERDTATRQEAGAESRREADAATQREQARQAEAIGAARKALASPDWTGLLPHVRHPDRVGPLMEAYYAANPWRPLTITAVTGGRFESIQGRMFFAFGARNPSGEDFVVGLEETGEGWKLDWEVLVPLAEQEWERFLEDHPYEPRRIRVSAIRRTPSEEMLLITRVPGERAFGLMLWGVDISKGSVYAVHDKDSLIAAELTDFLTVSAGKKLIVEASFVPVGENLRDDMVSISRIVTRGWTILDERAPGEANKSESLRKAIGLPASQEVAWTAEGASP